MGALGVCKYLLVLVVLVQVLTIDTASSNSPADLEENVLRDFYEYLMQREALEAGNHQVDRRARPYQSLRLRFGKRSAENAEN